MTREEAVDWLSNIRADIGWVKYSELWHYEQALTEIIDMLEAEPERLTDDDFETIRIHLNAFKEKLCNQHRWKEAEEYQRIIDRLMSFASAEPEIIRCKDCMFYSIPRVNYCAWCSECRMAVNEDEYCSRAKRRTDETN